MQKMIVSIPEPCHESWDKMSATEQGRFCNACAKEVIDFSSMSDAEMINYFSKITMQNVCGNVYRDQLDREITQPALINARRNWYWKYAAILAIVFSKLSMAKAQVTKGKMVKQEVPKKTSHNIVTPKTDTTKARIYMRGGMISAVKSKGPLYLVDGTPVYSPDDINTDDVEDVQVLNGPTAAALYGSLAVDGVLMITTKFKNIKAKIIDDQGKPIPFASIQKNSQEGMSADVDGSFSIQCKTGDKLKISAIGFKDSTIQISNIKLDTIVLQKRSSELLPVVVVSSGHVVGRLRTTTYTSYTVKKTVADTIRSIKNDLFGNVKIYPDPVNRGASVTIDTKLNIPDNSVIKMVNAMGAVVLQKETALAKDKKEIVPIDTRWSSGIYYLSLLDEKGKLVYQKKLVVN